MSVKDKVVVVTGGASGIGRELALAYARAGARGLAVTDLDGAGAMQVASEVIRLAPACEVLAQRVDAGDASAVQTLVEDATRRFGRIDVFCSNAANSVRRGTEIPMEEWQRICEINLMTHVRAARTVLPQMLERGEGILVHAISAAGSLPQAGSAAYAISTQAAIGFAEWLSVTYGDRGIKVSCVCSQEGQAPVPPPGGGESKQFPEHDSISPEAIAQAMIEGMRNQGSLIQPYAEILECCQRQGRSDAHWLR